MDVDLVIVGASVRAAVFSALRGGLRPAAADRFADCDLTAVAPVEAITNYPAGLTRALERWPQRDWLYTGGLENHPSLIASMSRRARLLGNNASTLRRVQQPQQLAEFLAACGLACPDVQLTPPGNPGNWLRKPVHSAGGAGIQPADRPSKPGDQAAVYYQRWIPGTAASALFLATAEDAQLLGITRQLVGRDFCGAAAFAYGGSIGPWQLAGIRHSQVERMGQQLARQYSLTGLFGIDLVIDREQAWFIELNPRYCASAEILEQARGESMIKWHLAACRQGRLAPACQLGSSQFGKAILFAREDLVIPASWSGLCCKSGGNAAGFPGVADIPAVGQLISAGQPVSTVFARGSTAAIVEQRLRKAVDQLEQQLYPVRSATSAMARR